MVTTGAVACRREQVGVDPNGKGLLQSVTPPAAILLGYGRDLQNAIQFGGIERRAACRPVGSLKVPDEAPTG